MLRTKGPRNLPSSRKARQHDNESDGPVMSDGQTNHVPVRMCVICRRRFPKRKLTRYIRPADAAGPIEDESQTRPGRGYYLCDDEACLQRISKYKGWQRSAKG